MAIAFTVKSRRERSVSMSSENVTSGLRLSGRYTSARNVVISKRLAVLLAADRAEALALQPHRVGPRPHDRFDRVGPRVGRDVDVVRCRGRGARRARCRRRGTRGGRPRAGARRAAGSVSPARRSARAGRERRSQPPIVAAAGSARVQAAITASRGAGRSLTRAGGLLLFAASSIVCCSIMSRRSCGVVDAAIASRRSMAPCL